MPSRALRTFLLTIIAGFYLSSMVMASEVPAPAALSVEQISAMVGNPQKLNGVVSYHDGPNCFNATLIGMGYLQQIAFSDGLEMRYFLERYCLPRNGAPQPGDVLLLSQSNSLTHGALYLGEEKIFEKYSVAGRFGQFRNNAFKDSILAIRTMSDSDVFMGRREELQCQPGECAQRLVYSCAPAFTVNSDLLKARLTKPSVLIDQINGSLQGMMLDSKPFELDDSILGNLQVLVREVSQLTGDHPEHLYVLIKATSLIGYLYNLGGEQILEPPFVTAREQLRFHLRNLQTRIQKFDHSEKTARILAEPSWLGGLIEF